MAATALWGLAIILLAGLLAAAGATLVQRLVPVEMRKSHNVAMGIIYGGLSVLFGVMIGFTAFLVLGKYNGAQETVQSEAGDLEELHDLAQRLPEQRQEEIQQSAAAYARAVVDDEWPLMAEGRASPRAEALAGELQRTVREFEPTTSAEQALYARGLEAASDLEESRQARLLDAREGLPPVLWIALVGLSINMLLFTFLLGMDNTRLHALMVSVLAMGIALVLFTIGVLDRPFGTEVRVGPEPFELVLHTIEETDRQ